MTPSPDLGPVGGVSSGQAYAQGHSWRGSTAPSGVKFWAFGLLWFLPLVGPPIASILLVVLAVHERREVNTITRENARWAANWVLTVTSLAVVAVVLITVNLLQVGSNHSATALLTIANLLLWVAGASHLLVSILGMVRARELVFNPRVAIPFFSPI